VRRKLRAIWLGRQPYTRVHELQHELHEARRQGRIGDTVLFLEHEPVITYGRGADEKNVLLSETELASRGVIVEKTGRGGDVTLHAPGQLVCYPILDLSPDRCDVRRYVRDLSQAMQRLVAIWGIDAGTIERYIGLWVDRASQSAWPGAEHLIDPVKIGAIGVRISRWVTMHGFALNLTTDLDLFRLIVPCGISEFNVGSVQSLTGESPSVETAAQTAFAILAEIFDAEATDFDSISKLSEVLPQAVVTCAVQQ
jgi:lipoyl(octanoyl) transferase